MGRLGDAGIAVGGGPDSSRQAGWEDGTGGLLAKTVPLTALD